MEYRLLGPVEVVADGHRLPVHGGKVLGLVALLALDVGRTVPTSRLVDGLYREPPRTVENALQQLVAKLRRSLAEAGSPDQVVTRSGGYSLDVPADAVDACRFERTATLARAALAAGDDTRGVQLLREALALWRGEALAGALLEGEAAGLRARLAELRDAAVDDRIDGELRLGRHAALVAELEAMVAATPLRERRWGQLVVALYRCGRQSDALGAYRQARDTLAEQLGVRPGPALRDLEAAVLTHDPALAPPEGGDRAPARRIPRARTSCLGREVEIAQIAELLRAPGLTTLVGPGGVGKTRLALEVAAGLPGVTHWVELAPVVAGGVGEAIGRAVGVDDVAVADEKVLVTVLGRALAARRTALVLDNCEHLVAEVAAVVSDLLDEVPGLWVLATSREPLGVPGETVAPVPPLPLHAAVALFAERARAAGVPVAERDTGPAGPVADICRSLDGLPLAVELAAARARHLGVAEIARRMDERFDLLTAGPRTAVARQRTLRAVVEWSFALLGEPERELFTRLCVFEGGFALDAAEAVDPGADAAWTLELLGALVDKSLVIAGPVDGEPRFHMLETLRRYGLEQLSRSGGLDAARRAHRRYVVDLAAAAASGLLSPEYGAWRRRLERELPNVRAACGGEHVDALRIACALWWFWGSTDRQREGRRLIEEALALGGAAIDAPLRAWALTVLGYLAGQQLDLAVAVDVGERALALSREVGDELGLAAAQQALGLTLETAGQHDRSAALLAPARAVWDAAGVHQQVAANDVVSCVRALATGDLDAVDATSREVLRRCELGGRGPFACWGHLLRARLAELRGDREEAAAECARATAAARELGLAHHLSFALDRSGRLAADRGDLPAAEALLTEALDVAESAGAGWFAALARVDLADVRGAKDDVGGAEELLRAVVAWAAEPVAGTGRVAFFRRLAGDPGALARARLSAPHGRAPTSGPVVG